MAPLKPRSSIFKQNFASHFSQQRAQAYSDTSRGGSSHNIRSIAWNPQGSLIATGAADKTLRVWNPEKPNVRFSTELKGHAAPIEKVAFNPVKDAELCSVSNDGVVKFWDVRTKACVNEVKGLGEAFTLAWHPDGESLIVGTKRLTPDRQSDKLHILSPTQSAPLASHQQPVQTNQISFCWGGKKVFVSTGEGKVRVLSYPDLQPLMHYNYDRSRVDGPGATRRVHDEGPHLVLPDWICQRSFTDMVGPVKSLSFTWDGYYVVGGSDEGTGIECYHCESGERVHTFKTASPSPVVSWAPTRYHLAYSDLGQLRIIAADVPDRK
ncbi:hypothetical protein INS49_008239 [Diaporthe citri]|uniref:uncharacterized protein n=1 Tax=Diaporthe citri TaxID=83186 RepID=UPI001C7F09CD|nr:uncharacterized protein INS49_008239 [Diaporthe citri]KAG6363144.1 hypothetical protein INS49_008239 [Diaporthe citri]